ncbi:MAG: molybdopterin-dependent oxidoreductase [Nitrospirae bacterium]|nr:molybdopterin-dependent oxidoreductase [Nitrospirota bacterium]
MNRQKHYAMLIDLRKCVGCYACQTTCKAEYNIPLGTSRCRVETFKSGSYPDIKKFFLPRLCNHCDNAPCIEACSEDALFKNDDGVVEIHRPNCIGCGQCREKCPYNAIEIDAGTGRTEKCDFCHQRILGGLSPVCVQSCMGKAIIFGDINDKKSGIYSALKKNQIKVLNPELGTSPSVFYISGVSIEGSPLKEYQQTNGRHARRTSKKGRHQAEISAQAAKTSLVFTSDVMCPSECGISVLVEDGIAKKIYGNPHSLINNGAFCAKGASGLQLTYSPHRIKTPLMRTGQRGEDKWKPATWDYACSYIAKKLVDIKKKFGPETVFFDGGDVTDREAYNRLFHAFGTPHTYNHGSICDPNRKWGQKIMAGDERLLPDLQRPVLIRDEEGRMHLKKTHDIKLLLHAGVNPFVATRFNYMSAGITAARTENKCFYISADPSYTNSAALSDMWLPIIPGTDADLFAAMLYYIIKNDARDHSSKKYMDYEFLEKYTDGWEEFKRSFLSYAGQTDPSNGMNYFSLEWAEEKTGIAKQKIEQAAHLFGITKPAAIEIGMHGTAHHTNGDVTSVLMMALCAVTGNIDKPGGLVFIDSQKVKKGLRASGAEFLEKTVVRKINGRNVSGRLSELHKDFYGDYPAAWKGVLSDLPAKIREGVKLKHGTFKGHEYPVKALFVRSGNPVITAGNTPDWIDALTMEAKTTNEIKPSPPLPTSRQGWEGFERNYLLDLLVFIDTHITVTGKYADIILPEAGFLERMGLSDVYTMSPEVAIRDQVLKPLHESKTQFEIMCALAEALVKNSDPVVKAEDFHQKYKNEEDFINDILSDAPGFYNIGEPLPYHDLPHGALITGAPDNPTAVWGEKLIKKGEPVTVKWLREHNGVAVWPASYYRYKKEDGSPSGIYPRTDSKKFEFHFNYLQNFNKKFGTNYPLTFYWSGCRWNPKNSEYKNISKKYPFQLISGRVHHATTMTQVCPYLAETETECMKPMNNKFTYPMPDFSAVTHNASHLSAGQAGITDYEFKANTVSIPVFAFNTKDGEKLGIKTGDVVTLENPLKKTIRGKVYLTEEIMPGVIKTAFGPGGQKASGVGFLNHTAEYTPNINELFDPENLSPFTGMPGFGDIMVKVVKE